MLYLKRGKTVVAYKHIIVPIKITGVEKGKPDFVPNWELLKTLQKKSTVLIRDEDFDRWQREGETVIVNEAGGWCVLTSSDELAPVK